MPLLLTTVAALAVWLYLRLGKAEARITPLSIERDEGQGNHRRQRQGPCCYATTGTQELCDRSSDAHPRA
jgi:hypothetical protein